MDSRERRGIREGLWCANKDNKTKSGGVVEPSLAIVESDNDNTLSFAGYLLVQIALISKMGHQLVREAHRAHRQQISET